MAGVAFPCISRVSPVSTIGVWLPRNRPPQSTYLSYAFGLWQAYQSPASLGLPLSCHRRVVGTKSTTSKPKLGKSKPPGPSRLRGSLGGRYRTRTCDPPHVKRMLIPAELIVRQLVHFSAIGAGCQHFFCRAKKKYSKVKNNACNFNAGVILLMGSQIDAPVAQLDRVRGYEPRDRGFESLQACHTPQTSCLGCFLSIRAFSRRG